MNHSVITDTDSYKWGHFLQYPANMTATQSYFESRGSSEYPELQETLWFGMQGLLLGHLTRPLTQSDVDEVAALAAFHGPTFNEAGWRRLVDRHGYLPVTIRSLPEGMWVPMHTPLFTVTTTDPEFSWVGGYVETVLERLWYPTTVATVSGLVRRILTRYMERTTSYSREERDGMLDFMLHDFGSRGVSSQESAMIGGAAHLVNFKGTDTVVSLPYLRKYYHESAPGFSINASEHSTIITWGLTGELDAYRNMLAQFGQPGKIFACVSDSYNLWYAIESLWGHVLKEDVEKSGARLVIRPDSGDPVEVVLKSLTMLGERFGFTTNDRGYKVLRTVRVIQGDGVEPASIEKILSTITTAGWSAENLAFGMGGALLQKVNRDTFKFAYKPCAVQRAGKIVGVKKTPVTDTGKQSLSGVLDVISSVDGQQFVISAQSNAPTMDPHPNSMMRTVYHNGVMMTTDTFAAIRTRATY